jgi:hypothetical protein
LVSITKTSEVVPGLNTPGEKLNPTVGGLLFGATLFERSKKRRSLGTAAARFICA